MLVWLMGSLLQVSFKPRMHLVSGLWSMVCDLCLCFMVQEIVRKKDFLSKIVFKQEKQEMNDERASACLSV
jgi:hypothetical protein